MPSVSADELVRRYYELIDAGQIDELLSLFAPNATYDREGHPRLSGREELAVFYTADRKIDTGHHRIDLMLADPPWVVARGSFRGSLRSGVQVSLEFADFFRVHGDLITERCTYFYGAEA